VSGYRPDEAAEPDQDASAAKADVQLLAHLTLPNMKPENVKSRPYSARLLT
jgi:hypothetical protein